MKHRVTCSNCGALCEYDDRSVWEGNRDFEDFECPCCHEVIARVFTDQMPYVTLIKPGRVEETKD